MRPAFGFVETAGNECLRIEGIGTVTIRTPFGVLTLDNVLYVPESTRNLISIGVLLDNASEAKFMQDEVVIKYGSGHHLRLPLANDSNRFNVVASALATDTTYVPMDKLKCTTVGRLSDDDVSRATHLHESLGHPGHRQQSRILKALKIVPPECIEKVTADCEPCLVGKTTKARLPRVSNTKPVTGVLERVHADILSNFAGSSSCRYALVALDEATNFCHVRPLENKAQALKALRDFATHAERQTGKRLKKLRTDNDSVFSSNSAMEWQEEWGFIWERSNEFDSRQNGKVERLNRTLRERMQACLVGRHLPYSLWPEAIEFVATSLNLSPREGENDDTSPWELFYGEDPAPFSKFLRPFGCLAWVFVPVDKREGGKGGPRAIPAIFLGFNVERRGWKLYSPVASPSTFWSNSVRFYEDKSWKDRKQMASWRELLDHPDMFIDTGQDVVDLSYTRLDLMVEDHADAIAAYEEGLATPKARELDVELTPEGWAFHSPEDIDDFDDDDDGWMDLKSSQALSTVINMNPTVRQAMESPQREHWVQAIKNELDGLMEAGTFEIVDEPKGAILVDSKLVLRIKTVDGIAMKCKARLVARGFTQREGLDFEETFSPVAPYAVIRTMLAVASANAWHIHCTDFERAYLNSTLDKVVYMKPPSGSNLPSGKCYKVVKGLYGLKQSGRLWNIELDRLLRSLGILPIASTPCVYMSGSGNNIIIIVAYVDDLILVSPSETRLNEVKAGLRDRFKMEDKGEPKQFCGVDIEYDRKGRKLFISQRRYIEDMVRQFLPAGDKRSTPMDPNPWTLGDELGPSDRNQFQRLVGRLTWVANQSRPCISNSVNLVQRFLSSPTVGSYQLALRILAYLHKTIDLTLVLGSKGESYIGPKTLSFTDATWASDPTVRRRSTSGSVVFVFGSLVSWTCRLQKCVALSAVEAELVAASEAAREVLFFNKLLRQLGLANSNDVPIIKTDSQGCMQVSKDPAQHWRLKHIDTRYYFVRDQVQCNELKIEHVPGANNPADILTKPVGKTVLQRHVLALGLLRSNSTTGSAVEGECSAE